VKQGGVDAAVGTELYALVEQQVKAGGFVPGSMNMLIRAKTPLDTLAPLFRRSVAELDPTLPLVRMRTMDEVVGDAVARPRFLTTLLGIFAGLALLLAAVGTYGILSYLVAERRQEIGIRMALGADRTTILKLVMVRGIVLSVVGLVLGLGASIALTRGLKTMLFNVQPIDPATLAGVVRRDDRRRGDRVLRAGVASDEDGSADRTEERLGVPGSASFRVPHRSGFRIVPRSSVRSSIRNRNEPGTRNHAEPGTYLDPPQRHQRIDLGRAQARQHAGDQGATEQEHRHRRERERIERADVVEQGLCQRHRRGGSSQADRDTDAGEQHAVGDDQLQHDAARRAERDAHADLLRPLRHRVREHAVDADRREQQTDHTDGAENPAEQRELPEAEAAQFLERRDLENRQVRNPTRGFRAAPLS
jgi:hypothetical protein